MKVLDLSLSPYRLSLARPLRVGDRDLDAREGLIVTLEDAEGARGQGDVAPLPGLHAERLEDARAWFDGLVLPADAALAALRRPILEAGWRAPPSAWFAAEAAIVALEASRTGRTPAHLLAEAPLARVPVNALFDGDLRAAERAIEEGALDAFGTVKVKVGRRAPEEERRVLETLVLGLPEGSRLRLDANRGLTVDSAVVLLADVPADRVEYVEEPVADADALDAFHERTGLAVALDETLTEQDVSALVARPYVTTLVLKPTLRGGVLETLADAEQAAAHGKQVVISSCFESGLGLAFLGQLAAAVMEEGVAAGLATDRWLAEDTIEPRFDSGGGWYDATSWAPGVTVGRPS